MNIVQNFILFETHKDNIIKKRAMYHSVNRVIRETIRATKEDRDHKIGVMWRTQDSGKSLSMVFFTAKIIKCSKLQNPTILVLTDRNDLDNQIYKDNFCKASNIVPYPNRPKLLKTSKRN